jgi:DNA-binding IclR family transcriptional regulator
MKNSVPGLFRGIQIWRVLCDQGEASLDQVTQRTGYPKASVLRMLQTLCGLQLIERNKQTGLYRALARIAYSSGSGPDFDAQVQHILERLSGKFQVSAEWFDPGAGGLQLVRRVSPPEAEVRVKARAGFNREWGGELDAIAAAGYAFYSDSPAGRSGLWTYGPQGEQVKLTATEAKARIAKVCSDRLFVDACYNANGVKRVAAPVVRNGRLTGVISLACAFTPSLDLEFEEKAKVLRRAADDLQQF